MDNRTLHRRLDEISRLWTHCEKIDADMLADLPMDGYFHPLATVMLPHPHYNRRRLAIVQRPFLFNTRLDGQRISVVVPPDFVTDFASLPSWTKLATSQIGKHAEATVIHDWLYALGTPGDEVGRWRADRIFHDAMRVSKVNAQTAWIMYSAVRRGGKKSYGCETDYRFRDADTLQELEPPPKAAYADTIAIRPAR